MSHIDSLSAVLPIENSPPGIQTMPAGAGPGAADELLMVVVKVIEPADGQTAQVSAAEATQVPNAHFGNDVRRKRAANQQLPLTPKTNPCASAFLSPRALCCSILRVGF